MKIAYVSIFAIVLVLLSGMPLMSGGARNPVYAKYTRLKASRKQIPITVTTAQTVR